MSISGVVHTLRVRPTRPVGLLIILVLICDSEVRILSEDSSIPVIHDVNDIRVNESCVVVILCGSRIVSVDEVCPC